MHPKVSIITVTYNAEKFIERALKSIQAQTYSNIETVIIDGQSQDSTLQIIGRYKEKVQTLVSEKDTGVYDAMNKGVSRATGEILYFLNADDYFYDENVIADIIKIFEEDQKLGLVCGQVELVDVPADGRSPDLRPFKGTQGSRNEVLEFGLCHQRVFARRWVFDRAGQFDPQRKVYADLEWYLSVLKHNVPVKFIPRQVVNFYAQGISHNLRNRAVFERLDVIRRQSTPAEFIIFLTFVYPKCLARRLWQTR